MNHTPNAETPKGMSWVRPLNTNCYAMRTTCVDFTSMTMYAI
jgi:hypothetical protein